MQAPTTSGDRAQEPLRVCPDCGAVNGPEVGFCWQCYRAFNGAAAPAPPHAPPIGLRGAVWTPQPVLPPVPARSGRSVQTTLIVAVIVAVAVASGVVVFVNRNAGVHLPEAFGGLSQVRGEQVDLLLEQFHAQADKTGLRTDMALYGSGGIPTAALVWVQDASMPSTDAAFDAFAAGFDQGLGVGTIDDSRRATALVGGVSYLCAPVDASPPANICMWEQNDVFWILIDLSGVSGVGPSQDLSVAAHDAVAA